MVTAENDKTDLCSRTRRETDAKVLLNRTPIMQVRLCERSVGHGNSIQAAGALGASFDINSKGMSVHLVDIISFMQR